EQASDVRKNLWTPLTVEGWALYCEDMMGEEGFYATEAERFFQRVHLLWRAVRVLLDVGLHTRGITYEQGVQSMVDELDVDRAKRRGPLIVLGYAIAVVVRPVIAATAAAWQVIALRVVDRIGKGLRTPPRDALIADVTPAELRGRAFGLQRGMDHAGAVLGPILAWWLLAPGGGSANVRAVIGWSIVPGVLVLVLAAWAVRDGAATGGSGRQQAEK